MKLSSLSSLKEANKTVVELSYYGDKQVIENLRKKRHSLAIGEENNVIRPLLLLPPGAMEGAIQEGILTGLEKIKLLEAFDTVVGVSSGVGAAYFALAGEAALGDEFIFNEMVKHKIYDIKRFYHIFDMPTLEKLAKETNINTTNLLASRPALYALLTNEITGKGELVDVKSFPNPLDPVIASMSIPIVSGEKKILRGESFFDGGIADPLPLTLSINTFQPTDVLIVFPRVLNFRKIHSYYLINMLEPFFNFFLFPLVTKKVMTIFARYNTELQKIQKRKHIWKDINIGVIYPSFSKINQLTMDKELLRQGILESCDYTERLFSLQN